MTQVTRSLLAAAGLTRAGDLVATLRLDPVPPAAGVARKFVTQTLSDWPDETRDTAVLVVSELVTNAVIHAGTMVEVDLIRRADTVVVAVSDGAKPPFVRPRGGGRHAEGGRGLAVVESVADESGTVAHPDGKTVWAAIGRDG